MPKITLNTANVKVKVDITGGDSADGSPRSDGSRSSSMNSSYKETQQNISKLIYGKTSLVTFLQKLFATSTVHDRQDFNYYFSLKDHIE